MSSSSASSLHVVLGAGQIGTQLAARLADPARGGETCRVRLVRRGPITDLPSGVEAVTADLADPVQAARAMEGATVAYHCVNPPYELWATQLMRLTDGIVAGARQAKVQRLVVLDNLYGYRDTARMTEETPVAPESRKGELRVRAAERLLAADLPVVIGRASDFFGPHTPTAHFGERFYRRVFAGKPGECIGDPDMLHSYSYSPDVAAGLATLGLHEHALERNVWMLPVQPAETMRALAQRLGTALSREVRVTRVPKLAMRLIGLFAKPMAELLEMTYQWERPFTVDDARFRAAFGVAPTSWDDAAAATAQWALATYGDAARRAA